MTFEHIKEPSSGSKISVDSSGKLIVPDNPIVPFIEGDGIGSDITPAMIRVVDSAVEKAYDGKKKIEIDEKEAVKIANKYIREDLKVSYVEKITETGPHHEYRERLLPAYVISYDTKDNLKAYVSTIDGRFQTVRHRNWRWFDFLWMTHTMDYEGRDDFNNKILRAFSVLGLITVMSGFLLWFVSSKTIRRIKSFFK